MGVAKAALEASVRYLAADLGPCGYPRQRHQRRPDPDARRVRHHRLQDDVRRVPRTSRRCARTSRSRTWAAPPSTCQRPVARGDGRGGLRRRRLQHPGRADAGSLILTPAGTPPRPRYSRRNPRSARDPGPRRHPPRPERPVRPVLPPTPVASSKRAASPAADPDYRLSSHVTPETPWHVQPDCIRPPSNPGRPTSVLPTRVHDRNEARTSRERPAMPALPPPGRSA